MAAPRGGYTKRDVGDRIPESLGEHGSEERERETCPNEFALGWPLRCESRVGCAPAAGGGGATAEPPWSHSSGFHV
jgi:hypothetical protein